MNKHKRREKMIEEAERKARETREILDLAEVELRPIEIKIKKAGEMIQSLQKFVACFKDTLASYKKKQKDELGL